MDNALAVEVGDDFRQLLKQAQRLANGIGLADKLGGQAAVRDVLQGEIGGAVELADVVDLHDVRVAQPGDRLRFAGEALPKLRLIPAHHHAGPSLRSHLPRAC